MSAAWGLRAARDPSEFYGSETLRKSISWLNLLHTIFTKIAIFHKNLKFHHHGVDLDPAKTFSNEFSGSSPVQSLNPHDLISDLTKGNSILMVGS